MNWLDQGLLEITPVAVTGVAEFDYFFTLTLVFGMVSFISGLLIRIISRS